MKIKDDFIKKLLKRVDLENKKILEVGCGDGFRTYQFSKTKGIQIIAIDPDIERIALAKSKYGRKNIIYIISRAEKLPFKTKRFDIVIFTLSLHHIKLPKKALQETRRVLKNKGLVVIIEPGLKGTIFQAEIMFDCLDGDERKKKVKIQKLIMGNLHLKDTQKFLGKTEWQFNSLTDFKKNTLPKKNIPKLKRFLDINDYKLWGERKINIFRK
jgi:ubiquinone/menaquinone biosynthesis C-methylase UbiE